MSPTWAHAGHVRVAVLPLQAQRLPADGAAALGAHLAAALRNATRDDTLGADGLLAMLGPDGTSVLSHCVDPGCATELGGALGVEAVLAGKASVVGRKLTLEVILVDVRKGTMTRAQHKADNKKPFYPKIAAAVVAKLHLPRATATPAPTLAATPLPAAPPSEQLPTTPEASAAYGAYLALAHEASSEPVPFADWQDGTPEQRALWTEYLHYRTAHAPAPGGVPTSYEAWLAGVRGGPGAPTVEPGDGGGGAPAGDTAAEALVAERQVWLHDRQTLPIHMVLSGVGSAGLLIGGVVAFLTGPSSNDVDGAYGRYMESPSTASYASLSDALRSHNQHAALGAGLMAVGVGGVAYFLYCVFDYAMAGTKLDHQPMPVLSVQHGAPQAGIWLHW
ncbi:MAG TPA: hypothetical protein VFH51_03625 [Myxococcota bacterium]|nr:hypothetical protein [Myxococcota bacterium]